MFNKSLTGQPVYQGPHLDRVAFPLGGIGAGMISLEGTGALSQVSLRHKPDVYHEPQAFAALHVKGAKTARANSHRKCNTLRLRKDLMGRPVT